MAMRERQLSSVAFSSGNVSVVQLPRDAVYHTLQLSCFGGSFATVQGAMGTGPSLVPGFPYTLIRQVRLIRNGSDVVAQMSGEQLAKEHFYLNGEHPKARLYTTSSNVETLRTASVRGVTIPANSDGIGANMGTFTVPDAPAGTGTLSFDMQADLYLQLGVDDAYYATLVDARKLASYDLEITWATEAAQIAAAGTANTSSAASFTLNVLSLDQDNLDVESDFMTFKRSTNSVSNYAYGSSNNQLILPRGNFFYGIQMSAKAFKTGSTVNAIPDDGIVGNILNRINTNFQLRAASFSQLQAKNISDFGGRSQPWNLSMGGPQGWAQLNYVNAGDRIAEMIPTYAMDTFDLQISINAIGSAQNGATTANTNPVLDFLYEEVIPAVSPGGSRPQGASAGSIGATSAKPYAR